MRLNLLAPVHINSVKALKAFKGEFLTADIGAQSFGQHTTREELRTLGYTHAQIRYGKGHTKVWYGDL